MTVTIAPNHPAIIEYLAWIKQARQQTDAQHEGNIRHGFATLLERTAKSAKLTLTQEYSTRTAKNNRIRYDGILRDDSNLTHGYWEAKDTQDNLEAEIRKKRIAGYAFKNIIFEDSRVAILYQKDDIAYRADLTKPDEVARLLNSFYNHEVPPFKDFQEAVDYFKVEVPNLAEKLKQKIKDAHQHNRAFQSTFGAFMELCKSALNPNIQTEAVDEMLIQHLLTERLIRTIFDMESFTRTNVIASEIEKVIDALTSQHFNRKEFLGNLDRFYTAIERAAQELASFNEKQDFLNRMYENFFQGYSVKTADTHGIVYTPHEIVDFMCAAVQEVLQDEWGYALGDERVKIIDPATGTGNFIVHLLDRVEIRDLETFYRESLFANEVMLMPYYIASLNIETVYFQRMGKHEPFEGLSFVDTLDLMDRKGGQTGMYFINDKNAQRVQHQRQSPINVIIGNPPYNVGQANENDNNKNRKYPIIDGRVKDTYVKDSTASLRNKLYDPYVKFLRWATDRLDGRDGIVCMVTNNSFVDQIAFDGMRKHLLQDFTRVYHLDLHGNVRQNPKLSGTTHNVFGIQVGVGITIAIKSSAHTTSELYYHRVPEFWTKVEKLSFLAHHVETQGRHNALNTVHWTRLTPNARHTWLVPQDEADFEQGIALGNNDSKKDKHHSLKQQVIFLKYSLGIATNRDEIVYDFNLRQLQGRMGDFIARYNAEVERYRKAGRPKDVDNFVDYSRIKWSSTLKRQLVSKKQPPLFSDQSIRVSLYRPFSKRNVYWDNTFIDRSGQFPYFFPTPASEQENRVICVSGIGSSKQFHVLMTNTIPCLDLIEKTQSFPYYIYDEDGGNRRENITDWALAQFQAAHGAEVTKWDIFYYVYGVLHDPHYRTRFADNLKKDLPRIPILPTFGAYRDAGKRLAELHVHYEAQPRYRLTWEQSRNADGKAVAPSYQVQKMKALSTEKHADGYALVNAVQVNPTLRLEGIPLEASAYRLGNRSALEWVIDQYQVKEDKRSGIISNPNTYSENERYIVELIERVVWVSVETVKTVAGLAEAPSP